jgi:hypothetical protein
VAGPSRAGHRVDTYDLIDDAVADGRWLYDF